jgi:hypothetical protein
MILQRRRPIDAAVFFCAIAGAAALGSGPASAADPIVGSWTGTVTQEGSDSFETNLTFVSPRGGVSRYPSYPCGGMLVGGPKGDGYEYTETINWGGSDERDGGCIGGAVRIDVVGNKMKFEWSTTFNGQEYKAAGELRRVAR